MRIEVNAEAHLLEAFSFALRDLLEKRGYRSGPSVGRLDSGTYWSFLKEEVILTVELDEAAESGECRLSVESETEIPGFDEIWDDALIAVGRDLLSRIRGMARDVKKIEQAL